MAYALPLDAHERPVVIIGAGTLGRRIATSFVAGGNDVRIFDTSAEQREAARDYITENTDDLKQKLSVAPPRSADVGLADDMQEALRDAWMVIEAVPERLEVKIAFFGATLSNNLSPSASRFQFVGQSLIHHSRVMVPWSRALSWWSSCSRL